MKERHHTKVETILQFQNLILKRITTLIKNHIPLKTQEVKKIFPRSNLYASTLYWYLLRPQAHRHLNRLTSQSVFSKYPDFFLDSLSTIEILIKASQFHQNIEETDPQFSLPLVVPGDAILFKNIRNILLGDILIASAINTINSLNDIQLQKIFYDRAQETFLNNIENLLPHKLHHKKVFLKNLKRQKKRQGNWISLLFFLSGEDKKNIKSKSLPITQLLLDASRSMEREQVKKKIYRFCQELHQKGFSQKEYTDFSIWIQKQIFKSTKFIPKSSANPKEISHYKESTIFQLLS